MVRQTSEKEKTTCRWFGKRQNNRLNLAEVPANKKKKF